MMGIPTSVPSLPLGLLLALGVSWGCDSGDACDTVKEEVRSGDSAVPQLGRCEDDSLVRLRSAECPAEGSIDACTLEGSECQTGADCGMGEGAVCSHTGFSSWGPSGCACFPTCQTDADCPTGTVCACRNKQQDTANVCLPSDCRTEADCPGGHCVLGGTPSGPATFHCRYPSAKCNGHDDCKDGEICGYRSDAKEWACMKIEGSS